MADDKIKRASRLKSDDYRIYLGKKLKEKRQSLGYSLSDVFDMTNIPANTILSIEKGLTINIDYYVEYAKAVEYNFELLTDAGIELVPLNQLSEEKQSRTFITLKIKRYILDSDFLIDGKSSEEIIRRLIELKQLTDKQVTPTELTGVMRNFVADETVLQSKNGKINIYTLKVNM